MNDLALQVALVVKNLPANAGDIRDTSLIPESGRSPAGGHGNQLQYPCLENPWQAVHSVANRKTQMKQHSIHAYTHTHTHTHIFDTHRLLV